MLQLKLALVAAICLLSTITCQTDTNYRLNSPITPKSYSLAITPYFDTADDRAFTFDGEVSIVIVTEKTNVNQIKLHSEDLEFDVSNISLTSASTVINTNPANPLVFDKVYTFVYINLESELQAGTEYTLAISYKGPIRNDLNGFYRASYVENGVTKWLGATQMEPTHARKVFPCFDEPSYKATFTISIDRPENYKESLANTILQDTVPLSNGYVREIFHPTPVMSTYLVAFLVSEFEAGEYQKNGTREFGIYSRPEAKNQSQYAFEFGLKVVDALSDYFGIDYYSSDEFLKLDHVALPDFRAGAMENWGLIKYREGYLLYVPEESIPTYKYRIAQIIAHETTHMWFGDLVTCHWWSNTWLNEGFANYFQDYITSLIEPEIESDRILVTGSLYDAYTADEIPNASAISNGNVNSPAEISGHFGTITYQKGGSVIRMIHNLVGDEAFRIGLNSYLDTNRFNVGYPEYLYSALELGVANTSSLSLYPGENITEIMKSWITQPGHPVLYVSVEDGIVNITQRRFFTDSKYSSEELYSIPITYATERNPNFIDTKPVLIMKEKTMILNVTEEMNEHEWIIFNVQETGVYRVNYDRHSWQLIGEALKGDQKDTIHHFNRAKIVNDLFAFLKADVVEFEVLYEVLDFLREEDDFSVWYAALEGFNYLRNTYYATNLLADIDSYALRLMENMITKLGFNESAIDSYVTIRNRMQILYHACRIGHQGCIDDAVERFRNLKENDIPVTPSLRPVAYCYGLKYGTAEDWDFLWNKMLTTNVANEVTTIQAALGCTRVEEKIKSYLLSPAVPESAIRGQDVSYPWSSVVADHSNAAIAFDVLKENYTALSTVFPSMTTVVNYVSAALHSNGQFEEFETWIANCQECSPDVIVAAESALENAKTSAAWAGQHTTDIQTALRNSGVILTPSIACVFAVVLLNIFKSY